MKAFISTILILTFSQLTFGAQQPQRFTKLAKKYQDSPKKFVDVLMQDHSKKKRDALFKYIKKKNIRKLPEIKFEKDTYYFSNGKGTASLKVLSFEGQKYSLNGYTFQVDYRKPVAHNLKFIERILRKTSTKTTLLDFIIPRAYADDEDSSWSLSSFMAIFSGKTLAEELEDKIWEAGFSLDSFSCKDIKSKSFDLTVKGETTEDVIGCGAGVTDITHDITYNTVQSGYGSGRGPIQFETLLDPISTTCDSKIIKKTYHLNPRGMAGAVNITSMDKGNTWKEVIDLGKECCSESECREKFSPEDGSGNGSESSDAK